MKTCIIIPAYNEERNIAKLIDQIKNYNLDIVVIDDGSEDSTAQRAQERGVIVLKNSRNKGKGASLRKGFNFALENNYDAVITMDADGQHLPEDIPKFLSYIKNSSSNFLIGNRMRHPIEMPFIRLLTNKFMSWLISKITKQNIPDTQCGFRLIKREILEKIDFSTSHYETESEIILKTAQMGFKIDSIPIKSVYYQAKSHVNPFIDTIRFLRFIFKYLWTTKD